MSNYSRGWQAEIEGENPDPIVEVSRDLFRLFLLPSCGSVVGRGTPTLETVEPWLTTDRPSKQAGVRASDQTIERPRVERGGRDAEVMKTLSIVESPERNISIVCPCIRHSVRHAASRQARHTLAPLRNLFAVSQ